MTTETETPPRRGLRAWLRHAFSMDPFYRPLDEEEVALLRRMADFIVTRRMTVPAVMLLESARPLNYVGSQAMAYFEPIVKAVFVAEDYTRLRLILERRTSIERMLELIEERQAEEDAKSGGHADADPDRRTTG